MRTQNLLSEVSNIVMRTQNLLSEVSNIVMRTQNLPSEDNNIVMRTHKMLHCIYIAPQLYLESGLILRINYSFIEDSNIGTLGVNLVPIDEVVWELNLSAIEALLNRRTTTKQKWKML